MACSKQQVEPLPNSATVIQSNKTFNFQDTTLDDAMFLLEEYANYQDGNAKYEFQTFALDTIDYTFSITAYTHNGQPGIDANDQTDIRDTIQQWIDDYASRVDTTDFKSGHDIIFLDVNNWSLSGGGTSLQMGLTLAIGGAPAPSWPYDCDEADPYGSNDFWEAEVFGGCSTNTATTSNAMIEMEKRLNFKASGRNCITACIPDTEEYYFDISFKIELATDHLNPSDPTPNDGFYDYLLYWNEDRTTEIDCLSPNEMRFHTSGAETIAQDVKPSGKIPILYDVRRDYLLGGGSGSSFAGHGLEVHFGKRGCK